MLRKGNLMENRRSFGGWIIWESFQSNEH